MPKKILLKLLANKTPLAGFNFKQIKSVLIRPIGYGLGDGILLTAILKQLKQAYPDIKTGVLAIGRNSPVFQGNPYIDEILQDKPLTYLLNRGKWQVFMDYVPTFTTKNIFCDFLLKPQYTICFEKTAKKHYSAETVKNYDFYVPDLAKTHLSRSLELTPFKDYVKTDNPQYTLPPIPADSENKAKSFLKKGKIHLVFAPNGTDKELDKTEIQTILTTALRQYANEVQIIIPFTQKSPEYAPLFKDFDYLLTPQLTLQQYFALIKLADIIVAADSAPVHIACAYKKPVAAFYGNKRAVELFAPLIYPNSFMIPSLKLNNGPVRIIKDIDKTLSAGIIKNMLSAFI